MADLITSIDVERVRENLTEVQGEVASAAKRAGRDPSEVQILAATKYLACSQMPMLAEAGIGLVGENRAQDLVQKVGVYGELFEWDFIGQLQSRKVRLIVPHVRLIHSVASDSALQELRRHATLARADLRILVEVNIASEPGKAGIVPGRLDEFIERSPAPVVGLMGMPPRADNPQESRRWFSALRELAEESGLAQLSMGTSQDYTVAVEEGATIVRIGTRLYS